MWFDRYKIEAIEHTLTTGQKAGLSSILPDDLTVRKYQNLPPFCPKCGKAFKPKRLNYIRLIVPACPDGHGVWLSSEAVEKFRLMLKGGVLPPEHIQKKFASFRVFVIFAAFALGIFNAIQRSDHKKPENYKMTESMQHIAKVSPTNWPGRDFSQWNALPAHQEVIVDPQELDYIRQWIEITNEGIVNRLNMHDALLAQRPAREYVETYEYFASQQDAVLMRLKKLLPPARMEVFHDLVVEAVGHQIDFYDDFTRRKTENPSVELNQLLQHPKLVTCDKRLWDAFYEFARLYPSRDTAQPTMPSSSGYAGWI